MVLDCRHWVQLDISPKHTSHKSRGTVTVGHEYVGPCDFCGYRITKLANKKWNLSFNTELIIIYWNYAFREKEERCCPGVTSGTALPKHSHLSPQQLMSKQEKRSVAATAQVV